VRRWKRFKAALEEERKRIEMMTGFYNHQTPQRYEHTGDDGDNL